MARLIEFEFAACGHHRKFYADLRTNRGQGIRNEHVRSDGKKEGLCSDCRRKAALARVEEMNIDELRLRAIDGAGAHHNEFSYVALFREDGTPRPYGEEEA